ncbi:hypothetical protein FB45DRAFT_1010501 [Roridomyces roridus]|uniref:Uncharacterized protein n=1 Tax=Roridomyces roridus TaxID=1738132 RepID=A0AAD7B473_9AGAR|nr:hypothetical protein FB45DRAFT_1010501 [Roridomyces roridus]
MYAKTTVVSLLLASSALAAPLSQAAVQARELEARRSLPAGALGSLAKSLGKGLLSGSDHSLLRLEPAGLRWVCVLPSPPPKVNGSRTASVRPDHVWLPMTVTNMGSEICPPAQSRAGTHVASGSRGCQLGDLGPPPIFYRTLVHFMNPSALYHFHGTWRHLDSTVYQVLCSPDQSSPLTSPHPPHHQWLSATFPYLPECQLNHPDSDCHAKQWPLKAGGAITGLLSLWGEGTSESRRDLEARAGVASILEKLVGVGGESLESVIKKAIFGGVASGVAVEGVNAVAGRSVAGTVAGDAAKAAETGFGKVIGNNIADGLGSALGGLGVTAVLGKLFGSDDSSSPSKRALTDLSDDEVNTLLEWMGTLPSNSVDKRAAIGSSIGKGLAGAVAGLAATQGIESAIEGIEGLFDREISFDELD